MMILARACFNTLSKLLLGIFRHGIQSLAGETVKGVISGKGVEVKGRVGNVLEYLLPLEKRE